MNRTRRTAASQPSAKSYVGSLTEGSMARGKSRLPPQPCRRLLSRLSFHFKNRQTPRYPRGRRCSQAPEFLRRNPESFGCGTTEVLSDQLIRVPVRTPFLGTGGRNSSEGVSLIDSTLANKLSALRRHEVRHIVEWRGAKRVLKLLHRLPARLLIVKW